MGDSYIYKNQKKLRWGYTTGPCAAAASLAAAVMLLGRNRTGQVSVETPKGIRLDLEVEDISMERRSVSCGVRKDAGDDPDVTDGLVVYSRVSFDWEENAADDVENHAGGYYEYKNDEICILPLDDSYERYFSYILNNEDISECSEIFLNELRSFCKRFYK